MENNYENEMYPFVIYTDGAYRSSVNIGGWGYVIYKSDAIIYEGYGGVYNTTNNRMELTAAINALESLGAYTNTGVILYTDSLYLQKGMTIWHKNWKKKNYKSVKNSDLWILLDALVAQRPFSCCWVKGHSGVIGNEIADELANEGIYEFISSKLPSK